MAAAARPASAPPLPLVAARDASRIATARRLHNKRHPDPPVPGRRRHARPAVATDWRARVPEQDSLATGPPGRQDLLRPQLYVPARHVWPRARRTYTPPARAGPAGAAARRNAADLRCRLARTSRPAIDRAIRRRPRSLSRYRLLAATLPRPTGPHFFSRPFLLFMRPTAEAYPRN